MGISKDEARYAIRNSVIPGADKGKLLAWVQNADEASLSGVAPTDKPDIVVAYLQYQCDKGMGSRVGSGSAAVTIEQLQEVVTEAVQRALEKQVEVPKPFSKVGSTEAERLLRRVGNAEVDGNALEPVAVPSDTPTCDMFHYSKYENENAGTKALLEHHQAQLTKLGVKFDRGGYNMYDLHTQPPLYTICCSGTSYRGNIDGCVAPYGLQPPTAAEQCRVAYQHKQSAAQKKDYHLQHQQEPLGDEEGPGSVTFAARNKGQAVTTILGAYAYNSFPLMFDLTDGKVHHVLHVRGKELYEWTNLTPTEAYYLQAELLNDKNKMKFLVDRTLELDTIPEELQRPMKMLRSLCPPCALKEQLDSIIPELASDEEKLQVTYELMTQWACRGQLTMPEAVRAMFT